MVLVGQLNNCENATVAETVLSHFGIDILLLGPLARSMSTVML